MDPSASTPEPQPPLPPSTPPSAGGIWLHRDGQTFGPYQRDELRGFIREGRAGPDDLVCLGDSGAWVPLHELEPGATANTTAVAGGGPARFHHIAPWLFVLLSLATLGLYPFWWFWMSWREAARRQPVDASGNRIMPFWRAFFGVFWFHALCRRIAEDRGGQAATAAATWTAVAFFGLTLCKRLPDPWWLLQLLNCVPALYPVVLVDRLNRRNHTPSPRRARLRWWQYPLVLVGLLLLLLSVLDGTGIAPSSRVVTGEQLSRWHRSWLERHDLLEEGEVPHYFYSDGLLWLDGDGNLVTDRGLVSYFEDEESGARVVYRARFEDIDRIEVLDAKGWPDDTTIKVWTRDATGDDEWFALIFSTEGDGDDEVVQAIRKRVGVDKVREAPPEDTADRGANAGR